MSASIVEQVLVAVNAALFDATEARRNVWRGRTAALGGNEVPAIVIRRGPSQSDDSAVTGDAQQVTVQFDLDLYVAATEAAETAVDALHTSAHAALAASVAVAVLARGTLFCTGTEPDNEVGDQEVAKLTVHYQLSPWVSQADLSTTT